MIYEVEVSEQADSDLRGIFEYIAFELQTPEDAGGQLERLEDSDKKVITILRVMYAGRDIDNQLNIHTKQ